MALTDIATHALLIDGEDVASCPHAHGRYRLDMSMHAPGEYTAVEHVVGRVSR